MATVYIATRHDAFHSKPNIYLVELTYADAPHLWAHHKYMMNFHNTRRVEGNTQEPIGIYVTTLITLPPFTRSHRITLGCRDTLNATTKLAILLASEDEDAARAAIAQDIAAAEEEAKEQNWTVIQRWEDFDK
jgi:hypothetical protein